ncbi:hypothetical protein COV53_05305 [Candidatus Gottesmanbacteria bacterium CG11_big_fil_rev_8_21_14_0_20_37_11]|uniref:Mannosyl-glycoprotein endo-beta-N-acetylglucosamidase-like domain-containing protein n=3 Tax=Candidatus Gottesmaniibacteriota TaxID=1752720 RepID=A0A2M7RQA6_9BACT|nr:MAG: hypothetical protein AUJ73_04840 [Candidatus Gottesmanbacteria bacterium CG1_02_37_22]PIP32919.1 MAG: hypothetical protein COX23_02145 [Candidatus Gottesmanbacteria bacterium CG23_combo_of_CG06-09_8_20_14_all_37_19]PIR08000.1 MAG: hypothetical protein COV53_05305 [Candidatus Gottesmanbacteria bacterium CG11_big_fil_rev_8_21_14_0_20_37_11]PIZ02511.1 MAG: hypothetical protein COY59_04375 [Candidatus Gottesmanbacteria bacterium CG_4_10_14_0_8_um_filter_37_24]
MRIIRLTILWIPITSFLLIYSFLYLIKSESKEKDPNHQLIVHEIISSQNNLTNNPFITFAPAKDIRIVALRKFLKDYNSPLSEFSETLVQKADLYGLDYRLIPAIAMQESGGCKSIPEGSYNCWGYGIYSSKIIRFNSYNDAIDQIAKTIKEKYYKDGLTNATLVEDKWAPPSKGQWSYSVNYFFGKIREYEKR